MALSSQRDNISNNSPNQGSPSNFNHQENNMITPNQTYNRRGKTPMQNRAS